jgi:uncharacterized membrane protein HdeD (DUF308 family)
MPTKSLSNTAGFIFILLGLLSVAYPFYSSLGIEVFMGALFLVGGIFQLFSAIEGKEKSGYIWNFCIGVFYILAGVYLLSHPLLGLAILTTILIALFFTQGVLMVIFAFQQKKHTDRWGWAFINGLITIGLGVILMAGFPISSLWAFGLLTGINLFMFGISILMVNSMTKKPATKKK